MKVVIVLLIILVTFGLPVLLQQVINPRQASVTPTPVVTVAPDDIRFLSVPPIIVPASSTFIYKIVATSLSGEVVTSVPISKPDWMSWDATTNQLSGTVPAVGGVFSVSMRASVPGGDIEDQNFTVTIETQEDVKGAKTVALWKDPFHPSIGASDENQTLVPPVDESSVVTLPSETSVLGEKTTATTFLTKQTEQYILGGLAIVLIVVLGSIVVKIVKASLENRSKLPKGVVIERGRR